MSEQDRIDTTAPEEIWLVIGEEGTYQEAIESSYEEICWCEDSQYEADIKYIRADLATAEANKRIEALESEVDNLHLNIKAQEQLGYELQKNNHDLREALQEAIGYIPAYTVNESVVSKWRSALTATPAESLQAFENEVIEKVYQVVENISDSSRTSVEILEAIRALKEVK